MLSCLLRDHFPFFLTAPDGWKNTIRHNLCFSNSFKKTPQQVTGDGKRKSCLWHLTLDGRRRLRNEIHTLTGDSFRMLKRSMNYPGQTCCGMQRHNAALGVFIHSFIFRKPFNVLMILQPFVVWLLIVSVSCLNNLYIRFYQLYFHKKDLVVMHREETKLNYCSKLFLDCSDFGEFLIPRLIHHPEPDFIPNTN